MLDRVELHECNYNWKTFIEVYLEDYHVGPFHPGLGSFVTCDDLRWEFNRHYSVQTVGVANRLGQRRQPGLPELAGAAAASTATASRPSTARSGSPTTRTSWSSGTRTCSTVSTLHPVGPQKTLNMVEFYYPEEIAAFEREFVEAQQAAYMETCVEDDEIAERMDAGRRALMQRGDNESRPLPEPDGRRHAALPRVVPRSEIARPERPEMQALWMVLGALIFATMGVCVKFASAWFTQRRAGALPRPDRHRLPLAAGAAAAASRWRTRYPGMHAWRSLVGVFSLGAWFYAIAHMPLATAMTLNYMSSVWIAAFLVGGALLAWVPVPGRDGRMPRPPLQGALVLTVLAGFGGVVLMLKPDGRATTRVSPGSWACCPG